MSVIVALMGCGSGLFTTPNDKNAAPATDDSGTNLPQGIQIGDLLVTPAAIDFGTVEVGASATQEVLMHNTGEASLDVYDVSYAGDAAFQVSDLTTPFSLEANDEAVVQVTFAPGWDGSFTGTTAVLCDQSADAAMIPLTGVAGSHITDTSSGDDTGDTVVTSGPALEVSSDAVDFGTVEVGSVATEHLTLTNPGDEDLMVQDLHVTDTVFAVAGTTTPFVLSPGDHKSIDLTFTPTTSVVSSSSLSISTDTPAQDKTVALTGEGHQDCSICAPQLQVSLGGGGTTIEIVTVFGMASEEDVTLRNTGDMDLHVTKIEAVNEPLLTCGDFSVVGSTSATITPGSTYRFAVRYQASTDICGDAANVGMDWNMLHIHSDDPSHPNYAIEMNGGSIL